MKKTLSINNKIVFIFIITIIALLYVNQQILIYQIGLRIKENYQIYSRLVDQNRILEYNVLNLKSPVNLENRLSSKRIELRMPQRWQVVKVLKNPIKVVNKDKVKSGLFANLFVVSREAEASPTNTNSIAKVTH
jgi:hypothetical protein